MRCCLKFLELTKNKGLKAVFHVLFINYKPYTFSKLSVAPKSKQNYQFNGAHILSLKEGSHILLFRFNELEKGTKILGIYLQSL